jgi:recombination protein RecR
MNPIISKLADYFEKLPGIGPRQARRFVYALLSKDSLFLAEFSKLISNLKKEVVRCKTCHRFFELAPTDECKICSDLTRDKRKLLIVEKDVDLDNIEKAGFYNGFYYILGGLIPALGSEIPKEVKMRELFEKTKKDSLSSGLKEIILAFSATPEGDNTSRYIEKILEPIIKKCSIKISRLGKGLSTGTELEYSDKDTIINALKNRK